MTVATDKPKRAFTAARIVALVLIGLMVLGLAYLRFAPDSGSVSVPDGAMAGDLILEDCDYATENGSYAADCGTLVVPENRADSDSRLIAVPVTRIHAQSEDPGEPIFRLEGGPGVTNMQFSKASRFAENHDVVLVGYRGVDGSVRLDCPEVESEVARSTDVLGEKFFRAFDGAYRACADRLTDDGVDLAQYGLVQQVDDLEAARKALGYDRVNLLSESAGTRTALIYAWRHPQSIHRSVMIGVNPPGRYLWDEETTNEQLARYTELCSEDAHCAGRTDDLVAAMSRNDIPDEWLFLPIEDANVRIAAFFGLMESTSEAAPLNAPLTLDSWLSVAEGDASGFWLASLFGDVALPKMTVWGQRAAVGSIDAQAAREYFSSGPEGRESNLGYAATAFVWGGGRMVDAWPATAEADEYRRLRTSEVETLLVGGELDFATPPQHATEELLPYLPNGRQVVLEELGHTVDFWSQQPDANGRLINTFFDSGEVDDSLYEPGNVDFTPSVSHGTIAKIALGSLLGLSALTVLSLLLMALRARRRPFGRKASAVLRSLYTVVLGLGGWSLGALLVLTTMPDVPLDHELLAALSIGLPIGLGVYFASVNRERPGKTAGFAAALAGALAGAWLGFHATVDMAALLTAIAGAVVGGNLSLIVLDISRERRARARVAAVDAALEAQPTAG
jgi:pimeloyl-ACP methyl ester carboxylesterase